MHGRNGTSDLLGGLNAGFTERAPPRTLWQRYIRQPSYRTPSSQGRELTGDELFHQSDGPFCLWAGLPG